MWKTQWRHGGVEDLVKTGRIMNAEKICPFGELLIDNS